MLPPVWTTEELAPLLRCTPDSVEVAARAGRLPGLKFGREWVFPVEATISALNALALHEMTERAPAQVPPAPSIGIVGRTEPAANSSAPAPAPAKPGRRASDPPKLSMPPA